MGIMPKGLESRPEVHELGHDLLQAFNVLSSSRQHGMNGPQAITIGEMHHFCQMFSIVGLDERETFVATMQRLDGAYMAGLTEKTDKGSKSVVVDGSPAVDNRPPPGDRDAGAVTTARG